MKHGLTDESYNLIKEVIEKNNQYQIKLFGSRAKGTYKNNSDIDLAVFEDFINATNRLEEALKEEATDIVIDGILHRFEFTFELAWKTMKDYMEFQGIVGSIGSPREIIKEAFVAGLIEDGELWIKMMLARNSLSHLYDEETSRQIYNEIKGSYILQFKKLIEKLETVEKE